MRRNPVVVVVYVKLMWLYDIAKNMMINVDTILLNRSGPNNIWRELYVESN